MLRRAKALPYLLRVLFAYCAMAIGCGSEVPQAHSTSEQPSADCIEATQHSEFGWIVGEVFEVSCTSSTCHRSQSKLENLNLTDAMAYQSLTQKSEGQPTLRYVEPGDPSQSYLMVKLGDYDQSLLSGRHMPTGGALLCTEKRDAIARWIAQGAPQ